MSYTIQSPKIIDGINWATRTFNNKDFKPEEQETEVPTEEQETEVPKPLKHEKKKPVIIEAMPGESLPENCPDYRPFLQRDGLILFSWEIYGDCVKIVWLSTAGGMKKYQAWIDDEGDLPTISPERRYHEGYDLCSGEREADFIIYAAPPDLTANTRSAFIAKLKTAGVSVNFDYEFTLGKQKAAREAAVYDRIEPPKNYLSADEAEFLNAYRQLDDNNKPVFIEYVKALLSEQEEGSCVKKR